MTTTAPRFYLRHATPAGVRYAYPKPTVEASTSFSRRNAQWLEGTEAGDWIITLGPVDTLTATWTEPAALGSWRKVPFSAIVKGGRVVQNEWQAAPETPDAAALRLLNDVDPEDDDDGLEGSLLRRIYRREHLPGEARSQVFDVSGYVEMPGAPDDRPDVPWVLNDRSLAALYGPGFAHLFPGRRPGFHDAVADALKELDQVKHVFANYERSGKIRCHWVAEWDIPKRRERYSGEKGKGPFFTKVAVDQRVDLFVPQTLQAMTKADAIEGWDDAVAEFVARFVPTMDAITACSHCDGRGYHRSTTVTPTQES